jgi:flagellar L-ring protein precursor FlgH
MRLTLLALLLALAPAAAAQSMYSSSTSMFSAPRANRVGDPITVILAERTSASRASGHQDQASGGAAGGAALGGSLGGSFDLNARIQQDSEFRNRTTQSDLLTGTITARVVEIDSTGNLRIKGERKLSVNGVTHRMKVEGAVRPLDVGAANTVLSHQIANADVLYQQDGFATGLFRPKNVMRIGLLGLLAGAIVFGATQAE